MKSDSDCWPHRIVWETMIKVHNGTKPSIAKSPALMKCHPHYSYALLLMDKALRAYHCHYCNNFPFLFVLQLKSANKSSSIASFKDPAISSSQAVLDLVDAIKPGIVDYSLVTPGETDEVRNELYSSL